MRLTLRLAFSIASLLLVAACGSRRGSASGSPSPREPSDDATRVGDEWGGDWSGQWRAATGETGTMRATWFQSGADVQGSLDIGGSYCFEYSDFFGFALGDDLQGEVTWLDYVSGTWNEAQLTGELVSGGSEIRGQLVVTGGDCEGAEVTFRLAYVGSAEVRLGEEVDNGSVPPSLAVRR